MSTFIIAEAGVNHNGDPSTAFKLVDNASKTGADSIKFQLFNTDLLAIRNLGKADYQKKTTSKKESQYQMLKRLELPISIHKELFDYCSKSNIEYLCTAFDDESLDFLIKELDLSTLKIPSGEITNGPFLLRHARPKKKIILSTGMASLKEIEQALSIIAFGMLSSTEPSTQLFQEAYKSTEGRNILNEKVSLLHCVSAYPTPIDDVNLRTMTSLKEKFDLNVGFSDHTSDITAAPIAVASGATIIEKHFTLDKLMPGPDHIASLEVNEFKDMVRQIRSVEKILGSKNKKPTDMELENRDIVRKSLVASRKIKAGEKFSLDNLTAKRPGTGISPMKLWDILENISEKDYSVDDLIQ